MKNLTALPYEWAEKDALFPFLKITTSLSSLYKDKEFPQNDDIEIHALLDSGSPVTIMPKLFWHGFEIINQLDLNKKNVLFMGGKLEKMDQLKVNFNIFGKEIRDQKICLTKHDFKYIIIGTDVLRKTHFSIVKNKFHLK